MRRKNRTTPSPSPHRSPLVSPHSRAPLPLSSLLFSTSLCLSLPPLFPSPALLSLQQLDFKRSTAKPFACALFCRRDLIILPPPLPQHRFQHDLSVKTAQLLNFEVRLMSRDKTHFETIAMSTRTNPHLTFQRLWRSALSTPTALHSSNDDDKYNDVEEEKGM